MKNANASPTLEEIRRLSQLASRASAALLPAVDGRCRDSHGEQPQGAARALADGLEALEQAGKLAAEIRRRNDVWRPGMRATDAPASTGA